MSGGSKLVGAPQALYVLGELLFELGHQPVPPPALGPPLRPPPPPPPPPRPGSLS